MKAGLAFLFLSVMFLSCAKDRVCVCMETEKGVTVKEYAVFDYRYKGYDPTKDECISYTKDNRAKIVAGKQDYVFECYGQLK